MSNDLWSALNGLGASNMHGLAAAQQAASGYDPYMHKRLQEAEYERARLKEEMRQQAQIQHHQQQQALLLLTGEDE